MKYVFIVASMVGGGTERVVSILANAFVDEGNEVEILLTANDTVDYELNSTIQLRLLTENTHGSFKKRFERIFKIREVYKHNSEAIFYSFGTETNLFATLASLGLKIKLVLSERNDPNQCHYKFLRNIIYAFGKRFVFQTNDAMHCFSKRIQKNGVVIPNPIKRDLPPAYSGEREKTIVAVGRLEKQKNHLLLISSFHEFLKDYPSFILKIYGQGELESALMEEIKTMDLNENVKLMGFSKNVLAEIRTAAMYVLSSDYEGMPNSLMEAMGIGLPVISTNCPIGGPADLITDGLNGQLVSVRNRDELRRAMCRFANDEEFSQNCAIEALKVREKYKQEKIVEQWRQVYN